MRVIETYRQGQDRLPDLAFLASEGVSVPEDGGIDALSFESFSGDILSDYLSSLRELVAQNEASDHLAKGRLSEAHAVLSDQISRQKSETLPDPVSGKGLEGAAAGS